MSQSYCCQRPEKNLKPHECPNEGGAGSNIKRSGKPCQNCQRSWAALGVERRPEGGKDPTGPCGGTEEKN